MRNEYQGFCLTQVLDGVVALLVVHFDGLSVGTADAVPDGITTHHDVLVLWWRPAHHNAVDQGADMERAGLVWDTGFWGDRGGLQDEMKKSLSVPVEQSRYLNGKNEH